MFIDCLADWYKVAQTIYLQTEILENDLTDQEEQLSKVRSKLFILKEDMKTQGDESDTDTESNNKNVAMNNNNNKSIKAGGDKDLTFTRRDMKTLFNLSCDNKTLVRENEDLISQLIGLIDSKGLI